MTHVGNVVDTKNGFTVIECITCEFKHVWPLPSDAELDEIYSRQYYEEEKPDYFKSYEEDLEWWNTTYDRRLEYFEERLPQSARKLLDIGSGPGLFLARAQQRGWTCLGIEPSVRACAYARELGVEVRNEFLTQNTSNLGGFDAIHISLVLEHVKDPIFIIQTACALLNPGGQICIVVPNDYNPIQVIARNQLNHNPWWFAPPHHLNYFNHESLERLMARCGLTNLKRTSTFPIDMFLLMEKNYVGNPNLGREVHAMRKKFEYHAHNGKFPIALLYDLFSHLNIGREAVVFGSMS